MYEPGIIDEPQTMPTTITVMFIFRWNCQQLTHSKWSKMFEPPVDVVLAGSCSTNANTFVQLSGNMRYSTQMYLFCSFITHFWLCCRYASLLRNAHWPRRLIDIVLHSVLMDCGQEKFSFGILALIHIRTFTFNAIRSQCSKFWEQWISDDIHSIDKDCA